MKIFYRFFYIFIVFAFIGLLKYLNFFPFLKEDPFNYGDLPPLSKRLEEVSKSNYHIRFNEDYYPCKTERAGKKNVPHPLYGAYVIKDYLALYNRTKNIKYLEAATKVGLASIAKMKEFKNHNALAFMYFKGFSSAFWRDGYSGLTQSRYANIFFSLYQATQNEVFLKASQKCFNSLLIPVEEGGVLYKRKNLYVIAEYPTEIPDFVLNGYISIAQEIKQYGENYPQYKKKCNQICQSIIQTIKKVLPLYDVPSYLLTRYMLTGPIQLEVNFPENLKIKKMDLLIPGWGKQKINIIKLEDTMPMMSYIDENTVEKTKDGYIIVKNNQPIKLNLFLSRFYYPRKAELIIEYESYGNNSSSLIEINANIPSDFEPTGGESNKFKKRILSQKIPSQSSKLSFKIPWFSELSLGHLVPWCRKKEGKLYNGYHHMHIRQMLDLYKINPDPIFLQYRKKWQRYVNEWKNFPLYQRKKFSYEAFS